MDTLFLNKDVSKILGITQRQVLSWTEKGLVVPSREATGAGTKREYDYINLLEFGLIKALLLMGFGVQAVKKILYDLREKGTICDWSRNFSKYHKEMFEAHKRRLQRAINDPGSFSEKALPKDPEGSLKKLEETVPIEPKELNGVLLYFFGKGDIFGKDNSFSWVIPSGKELVINNNLVKGYISESSGAIIVDLGRIRTEIDKNL